MNAIESLWASKTAAKAQATPDTIIPISVSDAELWLELARAAQERIDAELVLADAADKGVAKEHYRIVDDAREDEIAALRHLQEDTA